MFRVAEPVWPQGLCIARGLLSLHPAPHHALPLPHHPWQVWVHSRDRVPESMPLPGREGVLADRVVKTPVPWGT